LKLSIGEKFEPLLYDKNRYLLLYGGAGSGKSEFIARKIVYRCLSESNHRYLVLRKVRKTCKDSIVPTLLEVLDTNKIPYDHLKADREIKFTNNVILYDGLDEPEKIKSIKGITSIWLEETTEFTEVDFDQIDFRLRGILPNYKQIIMSFNPDEAQAPWLKRRFFQEFYDDGQLAYKKIIDNSTLHHSTVYDNPFIDDEYKAVLNDTQDETRKLIYRYGLWAAHKGLIYKNWTTYDELPAVDETIYGIDFGYTNPSVIVEINYCDCVPYIHELLRKSGLTNSDLISEAKQLIPDYESRYVYADGAEPARIEEFARAGFNIHAADKSKGSVKDGIDHMNTYETFYIFHQDKDLLDEHRTYRWKEDKEGKPIPEEPEKVNDHGVDAERYGCYTHNQRSHKQAFAWSI